MNTNKHSKEYLPYKSSRTLEQLNQQTREMHEFSLAIKEMATNPKYRQLLYGDLLQQKESCDYGN